MKRILLYISLGTLIAVLSACACKQVTWAIEKVNITPQVSYEVRDNELFINEEYLKLHLVLTPKSSIFLGSDIDYIECVIENQGLQSVKIIFDESSLVSHEGKAYRAIRGKTRIKNLGEPQPPLVVPSQAIICEDFFAGEEAHVFFSQTGVMVINPPLAKNKSGQKVRLLLIIEADQRYEIDITLRAF